MTSTKSNLYFRNFVFLVVYSLVSICKGNDRKLLSRLYSRVVESNKPLVLVLDSDRLDQESQSDSGSSESDLISILKQLGQSAKKNTDRKMPGHRKDEGVDIWNLQDFSKINKKRHRALKPSVRKHYFKIKKHSDTDENYQDFDKRVDRYKNDRDYYKDIKLERGHSHRARYQNGYDTNLNSMSNRLKHLNANIFKNRQRNQNRQLQDRKMRHKNFLRSPIIKGLLTLRNSLSCGARDQCQDKCSGNKYLREQCEDECEQEFDCEEEDTSTNDCEEDPECGQDENSVSTKGIFIEDEPDCQPEC